MKATLKPLFLLLFLCSFQLFSQEKNQYKILTVAFYNLENLFDTEDDPLTYDEDRTPEGKDHWTEALYKDKLRKGYPLYWPSGVTRKFSLKILAL